MRTLHLSTLPALAIVALSMIGCTRKIDSAKAEALCKSVLKDAEIDVKSVSCPKEVEAKPGNDFECTAKTDDGDEITLTMNQKDANGTVLAKIKAGTVDLAKVGDSIESKIGTKVDVQCKQRFLVAKVGKTYKCDVEADGKKGTVDIVFKDKKGTFSWKLEGKPGGDDDAKDEAKDEAKDDE